MTNRPGGQAPLAKVCSTKDAMPQPSNAASFRPIFGPVSLLGVSRVQNRC